MHFITAFRLGLEGTISLSTVGTHECVITDDTDQGMCSLCPFGDTDEAEGLYLSLRRDYSACCACDGMPVPLRISPISSLGFWKTQFSIMPHK